jgi:hypothetical protein
MDEFHRFVIAAGAGFKHVNASIVINASHAVDDKQGA